MSLRAAAVYALVFLAVLIATRYFATLLAPAVQLSPGLVMLGLMAILYAVASFFVSRLHKRQEENDLRRRAADGLSSSQLHELQTVRTRVRRDAQKAVRIGIMWVNLPILPIMLGPLAILHYVLGLKSTLASGATLVLGFLAAWMWWSVNISLWRRWASRRGVDPAELQQQAVEATLVWPRGHFFERTELDSILSAWTAQQTAARDRAKRGA